MAKWNMIVDVARCENCHNCTLALKDEFVGNAFPGYSAPQPRHGHHWIRIDRHVRGEGTMVDVAYLPTMCNHCDDPPCMKASGDAIKKRADGIVLIDPDKARGRRDLVDACPYGAIWWNEEENLPQHWFFDAHLLDQGWTEPRCAQACPTGVYKALKVEDAEMQRLAREEGLETLRPELGSHPRVYYKNLYRVTECFIGGSVVASVGDVLECVEGASVRLTRGDEIVDSATTDAFGDFKADRLTTDSGVYRVEVDHPAHGTGSVEVTLGESQYVPQILLARR